VPQQRLYYTLEALGKVEELHGKVYQAIHERQEAANQESEILAFAQKHGLDRARFQELYNSFGVSSKARRATQLQDAYKVDGVPALGVAGRWYTDGEMAGNMDKALQIVDSLIGEARKA
jgi:protein dithiol oxidoreductase (disulfide-forming)